MIKSKQQGLLIVISAPSGAGKGTIINKMLEKNNNLWLSVSETSRPMRANDIDGITYHFCTKEEFEEKIKDDYFLEYALYANNYYGTPKKYIQEHLSKGQDVILEIEIQGDMQIKKLIPEALFIFSTFSLTLSPLNSLLFFFFPSTIKPIKANNSTIAATKNHI